MKNVKRLVSLLMAVTLIFSLSVSAFAEALSGSTTYEAIIKVLDEKGNVIESAQTGDKIYVAVFFQKAGDSTTTIDIVKDASSQIAYEVDVPADVFADKDSLAGAYESDFNGTAGSVKITDWVSDTGCFTIWNTIAYTGAAAVIDPATPVAKHEITAGAVGSYDLAFYSFGAQSALVYSNNVDMIGTTLTITEAKQEDNTPAISQTGAGSNGVTTIDGSNVRYDNAYEIKVTLTAAAGSAVGVEFVPGFMFDKVGQEEAWNKYAAETTEYSDVLGAGTTEFRAALIGVPVDVKDATFQMHARAFVKNSEGVKTYGDVVTGDFQYTIPK